MQIKKVISDLENKVRVQTYVNDGKIVDLDLLKPEAYKFFNRMYWNRPDIFEIIPRVKHNEYLDSLRAFLDDFEIEDYDSQVAKTYENLIVPLFNNIEQNGLYTKQGYEYSKYNLFTTTGRPSNSRAGINYAALNKADGSRERFISRFSNGCLLEMDFDAYHIRLIADLVDYKLPDTSVHEYFAKKFYGVEVVTKEEYKNSKAMSFQVLYGGVPKELEGIEYFDKVKAYIFNLWDIYINKGYIQTPIYKRRLYKRNLVEMNPQKLFNYLIQAYETERNIEIMLKIQKLLEDKSSKLILYTYDAFLFDIDKSELNLKEEINKIMELPVKMHIGNNYNDMKLLT